MARAQQEHWAGTVANGSGIPASAADRGGGSSASGVQGALLSEFGELVFHEEAQRQYLPAFAYEALQAVIRGERELTPEIADVVAVGMKRWAQDRGATHFTHWFQPLSGSFAQKHDTFYWWRNPEGKLIETFSGRELIQQEPDASSFPSGGIRSTFEARGYTAWDPTSPVFILATGGTRTLCIPSVFISYTGEALDYKTPLLKSIDALEKRALPIVRLFYPEVKRVFPTLGWEQEFFLVDEELYLSRPDLVLAGRTLLGALPPKGQQLEDHYFAAIPDRVLAFLAEVERECARVGIPLRTRHNEVAPSQYECAPWFEHANISNDHNQLLMDLMDRVARRHGLRVVFHEKPFAGINGSGKHSNWSLMTDTGLNLFAPGESPRENLLFLVFFVNMLKAANEWEALIRASIATEGNDLRLGGHEAPPAIISVYIGEEMEKVLQTLKEAKALRASSREKLTLKIHAQIPRVFLDYTDRNRTSPLAFTGNKFELRGVGANMNCAQALTVLNTILAGQLETFYEELQREMKKREMETAILRILSGYVSESERIIFNGDNYSREWVEEAARRGLSHFRTTPEALQVYKRKEVCALFERLGVLTERENHARYVVRMERYIRSVAIEVRTFIELCYQYVLPAGVRWLKELESSSIGMDRVVQRVSAILEELPGQLEALEKALQSGEALMEEDLEKSALRFAQEIRPQMEALRAKVDELEQLIPADLWRLPRIYELLHVQRRNPLRRECV